MRIFAKSRKIFLDFKLIYLLIFNIITTGIFLPGSISAAENSPAGFMCSEFWRRHRGIQRNHGYGDVRSGP